jgi:hypothetical protein
MRFVIVAALTLLAAPAAAQNSFPTAGRQTVPGIVSMCLTAGKAYPCGAIAAGPDGEFVTAGGQTVPGIVSMCVESRVAVPCSSLTTLSSMRSADFVDTIGTVTRLFGGAQSPSTVITNMAYLGINNTREIMGAGADITPFIAAGNAGIRFDLFFGGSPQDTTFLNNTVTNAANLQIASPGSIYSIEGANEVCGFGFVYNGVGGGSGTTPPCGGSYAAAQAFQADLFSAVRANSNLSNVRIAEFTIGADYIPPTPDISVTPNIADLWTSHPYPTNGFYPGVFVDPKLTLNYAGANTWFIPATMPAPQALYFPYIYTEIGTSSTSTNDYVQVAYTLDQIADCAFFRARKCYIYEMIEEGDGLGLFSSGTTPKTVATAIHNLTTIIKDSGGTAKTFAPTILNYTLTPSWPDTPYGGSLVLQKSNRTYELLVWHEPLIWSGGVYVPSTPVNVTVHLASSASAINVYNPTMGTSPISSTSGTSVTVSVSDYPMIIELSF